MLIYSEPKQEHNATSSSATSNVFFATPVQQGSPKSSGSCQDCGPLEAKLSYVVELELTTITGIGYLKTPLKVSVRFSNGYYAISSSELDIHEGGNTLLSALQSFEYFFLEDFRNWQDSSDAMLTEDALSLKAKYLRYAAS